MSTHTMTATFVAPEAAPVNGLILGYARSSGRSGSSIARQRELLEAYSTRVFGRPLDGYHEDRRSPGANLDRPGLDALKEAAQTDQVAVIIVEALDRIARSRERFKDFAAFCEDCVIQLHTCSDGSQNLSLMR